MDLVPTKTPTSWSFESNLTYQGHLVRVFYYGDAFELRAFNDNLQMIDDKTYFEVLFLTPVDFSSEQGNRFLDIVEHKRLGRLEAKNHKQTVESVNRLARHLALEHCKMAGLVINLPQSDLIPHLLNSLSHNLLVGYIEFKTPQKVGEEIENYAIEFLEKRTGCVIELNSNHKLLRSMEQRGIFKYANF